MLSYIRYTIYQLLRVALERPCGRTASHRCWGAHLPTARRHVGGLCARAKCREAPWANGIPRKQLIQVGLGRSVHPIRYYRYCRKYISLYNLYDTTMIQ